MRPFHLLLAVAATCAWGFNFIACSAGIDYFPPFFFSTLRFGILVLMLLPFLRWFPGQMQHLLTIGFFLGVLHYGFMSLAFHASNDVASLAIVGQMYVPFSALLAALCLRESLFLRVILGIGGAFLGVAIISFDPNLWGQWQGLLLMLITALMLAISTVLIRALNPTVPVFAVQAITAWMAFIGLGLLSWHYESNQWQLMQTATMWQWAAPLYAALMGSLFGHGVFYYLLRHYPVSNVTPLTMLTPVSAVIFAVIFRDEQPTWRLVAGGLLTLASVSLIQWSPRRVIGAFLRR